MFEIFVNCFQQLAQTNIDRPLTNRQGAIQIICDTLRGGGSEPVSPNDTWGRGGSKIGQNVSRFI